MWQQAYDALKCTQSKLVEDYECRLAETFGEEAKTSSGDGCPITRQQAMGRIIALGLQHVESKTVGAGPKSSNCTYEYIKAYTSCAVCWMREQLKFAVDGPAYSPVMMASVAFILPLLETPVAVDEARRTGIVYGISQAYYYAALEMLLKPDSGRFDLKERSELTMELSRIYQSVLELQMRSVIHIYDGSADGFPHGHSTYWKMQLESIREAELRLESRFCDAQLLSADIFELLQGLRHKAELAREKFDDSLQDLCQLQQEFLIIEGKQRQHEERAMHRAYLEALNVGSHPEEDKARIIYEKGGLFGDSCSWIFDNKIFQQWHRQDGALLWVRGDRGKGKTMLACAIIEKLTQSEVGPKYGPEHGRNVCYFFCEEFNDQNNSATAVLRGLIYMLINQQPGLKEHLRQLLGGYTEADAWKALSKVFIDMVKDANFRSTCFLIDGLDECVVNRDDLLGLITRLSTMPRIKWMIFSRSKGSTAGLVAEALQKVKGSIVLCLESNTESISAAVRLFVKHRFAELDTDAYKEYPDVRRVVAELLAKNLNGTFCPVADICAELEHMQQWQVLYGIATNKWPSWSDSADASMLDYLLQDGLKLKI